MLAIRKEKLAQEGSSATGAGKREDSRNIVKAKVVERRRRIEAHIFKGRFIL